MTGLTAVLRHPVVGRGALVHAVVMTMATTVAPTGEYHSNPGLISAYPFRTPIHVNHAHAHLRIDGMRDGYWSLSG